MFISESISPIRITAIWKIDVRKGTHFSEPRSFYSLAFKVSGSSIYTCAGKSVTAEKGNLVFYPKGLRFTHKHDDTILYLVNFECSEGITARTFEVISVENPEPFGEMFLRMYELWQKKERGSYFLVSSIFNRILFMLFQNPHAESSDDRDSIELTVKKQIDEKYSSSSLSIEDLAEMSNVSSSYLRRVFKKKYGLSPKTYMKQMRLSQAENLMKSGYFSVTEVAEKCGFSNQKYFSNVFKSEHGISPAAYIKKCKAGILDFEIKLD